MFGEDVPALWADCSVQFPSCSKPVLDINGKVLILSDCPSASINADWFFPAVLILTNYVMLNLFVGMIMNNFAYISAKDGNCAVEDDRLMDGAYKYVLHFDPKIKGQIPLEQVYQLYNLLGAPLGNYGTSQSLARFLCIREELTSRVKDDERRADFSWQYENVFLPVVEIEERLINANHGEWKMTQQRVTDLEIEYRNLVMGDEFQEELLIKVGMKPDIKEQDKEEDDESGNDLENGDGGNETVRNGAKLSNTAHADGFRNSDDNTLGQANEAKCVGGNLHSKWREHGAAQKNSSARQNGQY